MTTLFNMCLGPEDMEEMLQRKPPTYGPQPLPAHIFNYHKCRTWELRKFFKDRKLSGEFVSREQAILELQKANGAAIFRLLELPPELRNHVYRIALTLRDVEEMVGPVKLGTQPKCDPLILVASKQVHDEARVFLYDENEFVVTFAADTAAHKPGRYQLKCEVCGLRPSAWDRMYMMGMREPMSLEERSLDWPEYIRRVEKLIIKIDLPMPPDAVPARELFRVTLSAFFAVNCGLYDLACFLVVKSDVKEVLFDISCGVDRFVAGKDLAKMLSPIRLFPAKKTFKIRHLSSSIVDSIKTPMRGAIYTTGELSAVQAFRALVREAILYEAVSTSMKKATATNMEDRVGRFRDQGRQALGVNDKDGKNSLIPPEMHLQLLEAVRELNRELSSDAVPEYEGEVEGVMKKREKLKTVRKMFGR